MASSNVKSRFLTLLLVGILATTALMTPASAQTCGCAPNLCCSRYGFCGPTDDYCGVNCKEGPCRASQSGVSVSDIVTPAFFNSITNQDPSCPGRNIYSRDAFLNALGSFPNFGKLGSADDSKREIAAFFAQISHETGGLCYTEEHEKQSHCTADNEFPCAPGRSYYGRGPIQLTGNRNYGAAGRYLNRNLLSSPEIVATEPVLSFQTALWFWMDSVRPKVSQGFGATTRAINSGECGGQRPLPVQSRVNYYIDICNRIGVAPGNNLYC